MTLLAHLRRDNEPMLFTDDNGGNIHDVLGAAGNADGATKAGRHACGADAGGSRVGARTARRRGRRGGCGRGRHRVVADR